MKLYYASLTDHLGTPVQDTKLFPTNKQAAAVAQKIIQSCGPAQGFRIKFRFVDAKEVARLLNNHESHFQAAWS
jgi:hypothetical protein